MKATLLKINENEYVQLRYATKEQKEAMRSGKIEAITKLNFEIGNVFDIHKQLFRRNDIRNFLTLATHQRNTMRFQRR